MNHEELSRRMGPYNPNQSHRSRMTKQGIILAKERKANVQKELDENIAKYMKSHAKEKALAKQGRETRDYSGSKEDRRIEVRNRLARRGQMYNEKGMVVDKK